MTTTAKISRRYAVALFELIQEDKKLLDVLEAAGDIAAMDEVHAVIDSPAYPADVKYAVFDKLLKGHGSDEVKRLVQLLLSRGKLTLLPEIVREVEGLLAESGALVEAEVISAVPLNKSEVSGLKSSLAGILGKDVTLHVAEDASMIGGFVVRIGDRKIDCSVKGKLDGMRHAIVG